MAADGERGGPEQGARSALGAKTRSEALVRENEHRGEGGDVPLSGGLPVPPRPLCPTLRTPGIAGRSIFNLPVVFAPEIAPLLCSLAGSGVDPTGDAQEGLAHPKSCCVYVGAMTWCKSRPGAGLWHLLVLF